LRMVDCDPFCWNIERRSTGFHDDSEP
jgi:hypothetical protein